MLSDRSNTRIPFMNARALYDFNGDNSENQLRFRADALIQVHCSHGEWMFGVFGEEKGWFPASYVSIFPNETSKGLPYCPTKNAPSPPPLIPLIPVQPSEHKDYFLPNPHRGAFESTLQNWNLRMSSKAMPSNDSFRILDDHDFPFGHTHSASFHPGRIFLDSILEILAPMYDYADRKQERVYKEWIISSREGMIKDIISILEKRHGQFKINENGMWIAVDNHKERLHMLISNKINQIIKKEPGRRMEDIIDKMKDVNGSRELKNCSTVTVFSLVRAFSLYEAKYLKSKAIPNSQDEIVQQEDLHHSICNPPNIIEVPDAMNDSETISCLPVSLAACSSNTTFSITTGSGITITSNLFDSFQSMNISEHNNQSSALAAPGGRDSEVNDGAGLPSGINKLHSRRRWSGKSELNLSYSDSDESTLSLTLIFVERLKKGYCIECSGEPTQLYASMKSLSNPLRSRRKSLTKTRKSFNGKCLICHPELNPTYQKTTLGNTRSEVASNTHDQQSQNKISLSKIRAIIESIIYSKSNDIAYILFEVIKNYPENEEILSLFISKIWDFSKESEECKNKVVSDGACDNILRIMQNHVENAMIQVQACGVLWSLCSTPSNRSYICKAGGLYHVINALGYFIKNKDVVSTCLGCLSIISGDAGGKQSISELCGVHYVCKAMYWHHSDTQIQLDGCTILSNCAVNSTIWPSAATVGAQEINIIVNVMLAHISDPFFLAWGCMAIKNFIYDERSTGDIKVLDELFELLVQRIQLCEGSDMKQVAIDEITKLRQEQVLQYVFNIHRNFLIIPRERIKELIYFMKEYEWSHEVITSILEKFSSLIEKFPEHKGDFACDQIVHHVVVSMKKYEKCKKLQVNGCIFLDFITRDNPMCLFKFYKKNGRELITDAMTNFPYEDKIQDAGFRVICSFSAGGYF